MIPVSLLGSKLGRRKDEWTSEPTKAAVTASALILYGVMQYHKAPGSTRCEAGPTTLSQELGISIDTVERGVAALVRAGLIRVIRTGGGRENQYEFLWSDHLAGSLKSDSADLRSQADQDDSAELRTHNRGVSADLPPMTPQNCGNDSAELRLPYKEEETSVRDNRRDSAKEDVVARAVRQFFPEADKRIVELIRRAARARFQHATDDEIALAVKRSHKSGQRGPGLFLSTVPDELVLVIRYGRPQCSGGDRAQEAS